MGCGLSSARETNPLPGVPNENGVVQITARPLVKNPPYRNGVPITTVKVDFITLCVSLPFFLIGYVYRVR